MNNAPPNSTIIVSGTCTGSFTIPKNLKLVGPATLDGNAAERVLNVLSGVTATLNSLTVRNGKDFLGAGIVNSGNLTLTSSTVTANTATGTNTVSITNTTSCASSPPCQAQQAILAVGLAGGGIANTFGTLTLNSSNVSGNSASGDGTVSITNDATCTVNCSVLQEGIFAGGAGGGILNFLGTVNVNSSTVSGNSAFAKGSLTATNSLNCSADCTVTQINVVVGGAGGGIASLNGKVALNSATISGNSATTNASATATNSATCTANCTTTQVAFAGVGGGGLFNAGFDGFGPTSMSVSSSRVTNNTTTQNGGGIFNVGPMTVRSATISGNSASGVGGGFYNLFPGNLSLDGSSVTNNTASDGGGIFNDGGAFGQRGSSITANIPNNCVGC